MSRFSGAVTCSSFSIAVVVTIHSSSFKYTMSVHAGGERNVCIIVVSTETPQTTTNPSQTLLPVLQTSTLTPAPLQVLASTETPTPLSSVFCASMQVSGLTSHQLKSIYILYLVLYMCPNMKILSLIPWARTRISLYIFKVSSYECR